jgi:hypothetical protein
MSSEEVTFGRFRFDPGRLTLSRDGVPVRIGSRAAEILRVLAAARGVVVTKDELQLQRSGPFASNAVSVLPGAARRRNHPFCDGHHILGGTIPITSSVFATASAVRPNGRELLMRKFGFIAAGAFIVACFGGWIASTNARVAPPASSVSIAPMQMMAVSANLPAEHFVDYSVIFPN